MGGAFALALVFALVLVFVRGAAFVFALARGGDGGSSSQDGGAGTGAGRRPFFPGPAGRVLASARAAEVGSARSSSGASVMSGIANSPREPCSNPPYAGPHHASSVGQPLPQWPTAVRRTGTGGGGVGLAEHRLALTCLPGPLAAAAFPFFCFVSCGGPLKALPASAAAAAAATAPGQPSERLLPLLEEPRPGPARGPPLPPLDDGLSQSHGWAIPARPAGLTRCGEVTSPHLA